MSKSFWGKDPFDDPFFTEPFDSGFGSRKEITIEELDNDGHDSVPDTQVAVSKAPAHKPHDSSGFSYRRVAYGGVNGVYYSSSIGQRTGSDGTVLLEIKEEDKTVGQAMHTISRGMNEKGHTLTKRRDPNGKEDSLQILHNLNEDELDGFEENWKANADKYMPGWNDGFSSLEMALALPWMDMWGTEGAMVPTGEPEPEPSSGSSATRVKKVTPIDIM
ncbi:putative myeloid leukemia factor [Helianthus annuus]|nr:putative myeloid leukemia factor [Helianthus annuus]